MANKKKFDGVVEAVHYQTNGQIDWVRAYERRGPTFSDYVLIRRADLIRKLKEGKVYLTGKRIKFLGSTFETGKALRVEGSNGQEVVLSGESNPGKQDFLAGVPVI